MFILNYFYFFLKYLEFKKTWIFEYNYVLCSNYEVLRDEFENEKSIKDVALETEKTNFENFNIENKKTSESNEYVENEESENTSPENLVSIVKQSEDSINVDKNNINNKRESQYSNPTLDNLFLNINADSLINDDHCLDCCYCHGDCFPDNSENFFGSLFSCLSTLFESCSGNLCSSCDCHEDCFNSVCECLCHGICAACHELNS